MKYKNEVKVIIMAFIYPLPLKMKSIIFFFECEN
jgi:hypothetical protein